MPIADSPLRDRVIFIVGARRSGTNWLERILTAYPGIVAVPTETYLFSDGIRPLADCFQHANPHAPSMGRTFVDRAAFLDSVRDLVDRVLLETVERNDPDARYVVERTPWHASHVRLIADVYPDARVIHIIRDGRAVARSLVSMPWGPEDIAEAAAEWRKSVDDARRDGVGLGDRYRDVVYETLLRDPRRHTTELFDWLGLDLSDELWERVRLEAGSEFNVDPGSPGIRTDKWRDELSDEELRTFERVAGDQLDALGYERAAPDYSGAQRLRAAVSPERLRSASATLRRPGTTMRTARDRALARALHADSVAHNYTVSRFERLIADGDDAGARDLLAPKLWVRIDSGVGASEKRGGNAADVLIAALAAHRERGVHVSDGHVHVSPRDLTTVATYELGDGTRWARTMVYKARGGKITAVGLYRYALS